MFPAMRTWNWLAFSCGPAARRLSDPESRSAYPFPFGALAVFFYFNAVATGALRLDFGAIWVAGYSCAKHM